MNGETTTEETWVRDLETGELLAHRVSGTHIPIRIPKVRSFEHLVEATATNTRNERALADLKNRLGEDVDRPRIRTISPARSAIKERNEQIISDLQSGMSTTDVGQKYNLTRAYIYAIAQTAGIDTRLLPRAKRASAIKTRNEQIVADLASGSAYRDICVKYGLSYNRVLRIAQAARFGPGSVQNRAIETRNEQILADIANGSTYRDVSRKYGLSYMSIVRIANRGKRGAHRGA
jgi:Mor family transcriptional regulator